jgi:hypothetical protein
MTGSVPEDLDYSAPSSFARQLACGRFTAQLAAIGAANPHFKLLERYMLAQDHESRERWASNLRRVLALALPVDRTINRAALFAFGWKPTPKLTGELLTELAAAGHFDIAAPLPGELPYKPAGLDYYDPNSSVGGRTLLAEGLILQNADMVRTLLEAGAPMVAGPLYAGEAPHQAIDLARAIGNSEVEATVREFVMKRHLDSLQQPAATVDAGVGSPPTDSPTDTGAPRRRRMGV